MLTQNMSGVSYVADHSVRQPAPSCDWDTQWDTQWDLLHFFRNNAGLVPRTEAPWTRSWDRWWCNWSQLEFALVQKYHWNSLNLRHLWPVFLSKATTLQSKWECSLVIKLQRDLCQRADLTTIQIELRLFADCLNSWIPRVFFSFCYSSRGIRIWCSLPPLPSWLVLSTLERWRSACCVHAATSLNLQERFCPPWRVDSMARGTISRCHLRTLAARTQSAVLRENIFVSVFKMSSAFFVASSEPVSRTLLTSSKPPTRREDDKEGML